MQVYFFCGISNIFVIMITTQTVIQNLPALWTFQFLICNIVQINLLYNIFILNYTYNQMYSIEITEWLLSFLCSEIEFL